MKRILISPRQIWNVGPHGLISLKTEGVFSSPGWVAPDHECCFADLNHHLTQRPHYTQSQAADVTAPRCTLYLACAERMSRAPMVSRNFPLWVNLPRQLPSEISLSRDTCQR